MSHHQKDESHVPYADAKKHGYLSVPHDYKTDFFLSSDSFTCVDTPELREKLVDRARQLKFTADRNNVSQHAQAPPTQGPPAPPACARGRDIPERVANGATLRACSLINMHYNNGHVQKVYGEPNNKKLCTFDVILHSGFPGIRLGPRSPQDGNNQATAQFLIDFVDMVETIDSSTRRTWMTPSHSHYNRNSLMFSSRSSYRKGNIPYLRGESSPATFSLKWTRS